MSEPVKFVDLTITDTRVHAVVLLLMFISSIFSFVHLIPLDIVPAVTGVSMIMGMAYCICFILWAIVMWKYSSSPKDLMFINNNIMFFIVIPAMIAATAMNVTSIQNTRTLGV